MASEGTMGSMSVAASVRPHGEQDCGCREVCGPSPGGHLCVHLCIYGGERVLGVAVGSGSESGARVHACKGEWAHEGACVGG